MSHLCYKVMCTPSLQRPDMNSVVHSIVQSGNIFKWNSTSGILIVLF